MKKMRKLIPAFAMLMIAAVMMSTASFAWFTMNEQVTATGMQVQAKASGNLLISEDLMDASAKDFSVNLGGTKKDLVPITLTKAGTADQNKWQVANGNTVDPTYGNATTLTDVDNATLAASNNAYFSEYVVYLATAGDAFTGTLQFDFDAIANYASDIANAYTLALYIADTDAEIGGTIAWNQPDYTYNIEDVNAKRNEVGTTGYVDTNVSVNIPSTYGKTASNAVGLKVIIRLYVDGALNMPGVRETGKYIIPVAGIPAATTDNANTLGVDETQAIAAITTYTHASMSGWNFYADTQGLTPIVLSAEHNNITFAELGVVAYYNGTDVTTLHPEATYVNNTTVPSAGTSFAVNFRVEKTANP